MSARLLALLDAAAPESPAPAAAVAGCGLGLAPSAAGTLRYVVVDVFTGTAFAGNPLAVVFGGGGLSTAGGLALAAELRLSETVLPAPPQRGGDYALRIFTPGAELPFAGHPSVGAAWTLAALGLVTPVGGAVRQECGAGVLELRLGGPGGSVRLTGGAPHRGGPLSPQPLLTALGLSAADLDGRLVREHGVDPAALATVVGTGVDYAVLFVRPDAVARARPFPTTVPGTTGLAVVGWDPAARHAHVRMFAADIGVPEDPATGSAATALAVALSDAGLLPPDGETTFTVAQGAEVGRPSALTCTVVATQGRATAATVAGQVVPVAAGVIRRPPR